MSKTIQYIFDPESFVTELEWERIFLHLTIKTEVKDPLFVLARLSFPQDNLDDDDDGGTTDTSSRTCTMSKEIPISPESSDGKLYSFCFNMAAMQGSDFLDNGRWRFVIHDGTECFRIATITTDAAHTLSEKDRIFPYGKSKYSYNVYFTTYAADDTRIVPILNSRFMIENPHWRDRYLVRERRTLDGKIKCVLRKLKMGLMQTSYNVLEKRKSPEGNHILFMSETKPYIWGNLKYIDERIKERGLDKEFELSYSFRNAVGKSNSMKSWLKTIRLLARQDYVFVDDYVPIFNFLRLSKRTKLIQVWHAGEGFKAVGFSRFGMKGSPHPYFSGHKKYDYAITGSRRLVKIHSEVFGLEESRILPLGMARMDEFLDKEKLNRQNEEFYSSHPECKGRRLILFSPTFRGTGQKQAHYDYDKLDLSEIYEFCGDEYIWAFKMHPFIKKKPVIPDEFRDRIIDLSSEKNINDLYPVTDIMITDYSSAYYEYSLFRKPVLFYTYDRDSYEVVRGTHKSVLETAPGKVCDTFDELMTALRDGDYELEKTLKFSDENFGGYDGRASDRIIDTLLLNKN